VSHAGRASRTIGVEGLARVEGEGSLHAVVRDGVVDEVGLDIFEPPRYFEAMLVGRHFTEAPDITARICGICPVAYQLSACAALEDACGVTVGRRVQSLRRLLYCGEWIQSHALHVYLLHAPDFLGCQDAVEMAEREPGAVERGLELKRVGNRVMECVGGRAIHPVNVRVGGFYRAPDPSAIATLADPLRRARDQALATVAWVSGFDYPEFEGEYRFVALRDASRYAIDTGRPAVDDGREFSAGEFAERVVEEQVERSTALHARLDGTEHYLTGPLARYAINGGSLTPLAAAAARDAGLGEVCANPFRSIVVRAVELVLACDEALALVEAYEPPEPASAPVVARAAVGTGATEAPRGLLLHQYQIDADGLIQRARIVPPTAQNQLTIEDDLRRVVEAGLDLDDATLQWRCEQAVRNHDPCISCAAHFLDVTVERP
jgi:coenzyme F420-reducing hydrogenase alpha subunit